MDLVINSHRYYSCSALMTPERWQQIEKLLEEALALEPSQRRAFLDDTCAGNEELRREVKSC